MPKSNSVLQTENDLFQREIRPNLSENFRFLTFCGLQNAHLLSGIAQLS